QYFKEVSPRGTTITRFDGRAGSIDDGKSTHAMSEDDIQEALDRARLFGGDPIAGYRATETLRFDSVHGKPAVVVSALVPGGKKAQLFFDQKTGLLLRIRKQTDTYFGKMDEDLEFDDYRRVKGIVIPRLIRDANLAAATVTTLDTVEVSPRLSAAPF